MGKKIEDIVREMAGEVAESLELELVDVEYVKEGGSWFLRVYIDKPAGISHDDCQAVSERLGKKLDEKDPIPQSYIFEVSSPGIERPLKKPEDFIRFSGRKVRASTFSPIEGQREFVGELNGLKDGTLLINIKGKQMALPMEKVAKVRLEADFN